MRVFFITPKLNFETAGGSVEEFDFMIRFFQERGDEVTVVTTYSDSNRIPHSLPYTVKEERLPGTNTFVIQRSIYRLLKKYEHEADVFHLDGHQFLYGAGLYRRLGGRTPVQAFFNRELMCWPQLVSRFFPDAGTRETPGQRFRRSIRWMLERWIGMPLANGIDIRLHISPTFKAMYERFGMTPDGMVLGDPIDIEKIRNENGVTPLSYRERNKPDGAPLTLFYSSRMVAGKGFDVLLEGFARVQDKSRFHLILGGSGPEEPCVRAAIARLGLEPFVTLTGWMDKEELYRRYREADIFIQADWLPYGTSISLLYAMALGVPSIVFGKSGLAWLAGNSALTFPRHDFDGLAHAIERLGNDRALRATLSAAAAERLASDELNYRANLGRVHDAMRAIV